MTQLEFNNLSDGELLRLEAHLRAEFLARGLIRTATNLMGEIAETLAQRVYGGKLQPPGTAASDVIDAEGRLIQVKTRVLDLPDSRFFSFSTLKFDLAVCLRFDRASNKLQWAREFNREELRPLLSVGTHGFRLSMQKAMAQGKDVTKDFRDALNRMDTTTSALAGTTARS
ncbi:DUF6998 domain-containing protein [Glutamicibacter sp. NPDC087344]|uniref:DUF6998 domain-containing protein n=1 Tax=Glutamicibacter sp. NPDC087344 TaxID=3363994 RepID=UPI0037F6FB33